MLNVDPDALRAAASRWQMLGTDLSEGGAPPVDLAMTWPSAAATDSIHAGATSATEAFQARISDTAAASNDAANDYQNHETLKAGDIKDVMGLVTSPLHDVAGMAGAMGGLSASAAGTLGQLGGQAVSATSSLANTLTSALSHVGSQPQTPVMPVPIDHPQNPATLASSDQPPHDT